ncbi:hypothetical protein AVEN_242718-1 [Araneus ventricosus]|uniref:Uncharacterized protein n=1 Tax=Araneus ventricosus TaxID=182803 RepID=A0A4Y2STR7_ARAVE|nr:hypothetical protein AVEN_242718-1 [Araneus ventricosus]
MAPRMGRKSSFSCALATASPGNPIKVAEFQRPKVKADHAPFFLQNRNKRGLFMDVFFSAGREASKRETPLKIEDLYLPPSFHPREASKRDILLKIKETRFPLFTPEKLPNYIPLKKRKHLSILSVSLFTPEKFLQNETPMKIEKTISSCSSFSPQRSFPNETPQNEETIFSPSPLFTPEKLFSPKRDTH